MESLQELFEKTLKFTYFAENSILKVLPEMARRATSKDLKKALEEHLNETAQHVRRLERLFRMLGQEPQQQACPAMNG